MVRRKSTPFFNQGPPPVARFLVSVALSVFIMVADVRFQLMQPIRAIVATTLYPLQWLALQPVHGIRKFNDYLSTLSNVRTAQESIQKHQLLQSVLLNKATTLQLENNQLRLLLNLKKTREPNGIVAEVIYTAADPYSRRFILNRGSLNHIAIGSPVIDFLGVLGQITRVYPLTSEVTLITDHTQSTPVINTRSGVFGVISGDHSQDSEALQLNYVAHKADIKVGDLLATNGINGVYAAGLLVAKVTKIVGTVGSMFAKIYCMPLAFVAGAKQVLVLAPINNTPTKTVQGNTNKKITPQNATLTTAVPTAAISVLKEKVKP
jgi:rod shape-determining protein MreC